VRNIIGLSLIVAVATFTASAPARVSGGHDGFHRYSQGDEVTGAGYTGARVVRIDRAVTNQPNEGCTSPYSGHPTYQTMWVMNDTATNWRELGTGHQCAGNYVYWFWGYGLNGAWYSVGYQSGVVTGVSRSFEIRQSYDSGGNTRTYYYVSGTNKGSILSSATFDRVRVGLESYAQAANMVKTNFGSLQYQKNGGSLQWWAGRDASLVNAGFCGAWTADTTWGGVGKGTGC
jgi:hypothetical protein